MSTVSLLDAILFKIIQTHLPTVFSETSPNAMMCDAAVPYMQFLQLSLWEIQFVVSCALYYIVSPATLLHPPKNCTSRQVFWNFQLKKKKTHFTNLQIFSPSEHYHKTAQSGPTLVASSRSRLWQHVRNHQQAKQRETQPIFHRVLRSAEDVSFFFLTHLLIHPPLDASVWCRLLSNNKKATNFLFRNPDSFFSSCWHLRYNIATPNWQQPTEGTRKKNISCALWPPDHYYCSRSGSFGIGQHDGDFPCLVLLVVRFGLPAFAIFKFISLVL